MYTVDVNMCIIGVIWVVCTEAMCTERVHFNSFQFGAFCFTVDSEERRSASRDKCVASFFITSMFVRLLSLPVVVCV